MYSSYSPLQRRQLREQTYTDTQSTYLLVYAPGRRNALTLSLAEHMHCQYKCIRIPRSALCSRSRHSCLLPLQLYAYCGAEPTLIP